MKRLILSGGLFLCLVPLAHATDVNPDLVHSLATRPIGVVVNNTCEIRGAVWERGGVANVQVGLINIHTGQVFMAKTNEAGVYAVSVPYNGKPQIFQERIASQILVSKGQSISILDAGVVCDHRTNAVQIGKEA